MEDHMTSSDTAGSGSSSVTMVTDSIGTDSDLQALCNRVEVLEQRAGLAILVDSYLRNRIRELERSERILPLQLASASQLPSMQHSQRLDQRLHMLREEVRTMTQEKERGERVWRERLQRCQRQLKAKEEEMSRQSQYFENFKTQLQHKLTLARDREQSLQNRIYTLEKQLLDMTVSAATGMATIRAVRITAGTVTRWEEHDKLPSMRGEGEGEEEKKEERRKQWQSSVGTEREEKREGDEGKTEKGTEGQNKDRKQTSNEARLQGFIISLQEDLRVLLEREEEKLTEQRRLTEQLQEALEGSHFLGCKVEEMKAEVHRLKLSESSLMEEVEELREENQRLQQILRDAANQTPSQSSTIPESTCLSPGTSSPSCRPAVCSVPSNTVLYSTGLGQVLAGSSGEDQPTSDEGTHSSAVPPVHHQATAESTQNKKDYFSSAKSKTLLKNDPLNHFHHFTSEADTNFQSLSLTTESLDEFKLEKCCSKGIPNLEESPSEESDALREAYRSLGFGEDPRTLQEQRDQQEVALQHTQEQLQMMAKENARLKLQLRKQAEEQETEKRSSGGKINIPSTYDGNDHLQSSPTQDDTILPLAQDDLLQALNQENRALADRIQELLAHVELREEEITKEKTQLREHISRLEEDGVRLEQDNQEQGCLILELTKKTEDDLNTIMELQQKLAESREHKNKSQGQRCKSESEYIAEISGCFLQNNLEECEDSLVASVLKEEEEAQLMLSEEADTLTTDSASGSQHNNHYDSLQNSSLNSLSVSSLIDQVAQLTNSVQSLKTEREQLTDQINSLREQQRELALSVQTQTEEKQQLTRTVWRLKEEKDSISQSLAGLKQEKEQLSRTICGLKDERHQFIKSMSGLKEEKEQLTKSLSALERDKEAIIEFLSSGKEERDQIMQSLQSLQTESDQLSQAVLHLKQERDKLTNSLKCLKEQRDQEQLSYTLKDHDRLIKSVSSSKEEKERTEHSVSCLKEEEKQIMLVVQGPREEKNTLQVLPIQTRTEEKNQRQQLLNPGSAGLMKKTETPAGTGDYSLLRCQMNNHKGNFIQDQSDLMREIQALGAELKRSQEELDNSHVETRRLHSELRQSETKREEAERKATQAAEKIMRLTDAGNQVKDTRMENDSLKTQVKELQNKLTGLLREKTDALSLKAQTEQQYNILTAQLKAKTVALEELNSEYIALKRGQGSRDDLSTVLVSLRARYSDIRAKYDALLKRKSQTDLDIAPLKAKLSCLVVKCQERNSLLVQMKKVMHRQGCVDPMLTQQVEHLLSDTALQDYTAAFTSGSNIKTQDYSTGFTPEFISKFYDYTGGFIPDQFCPVLSTFVNKHQENEVTPESGAECSKSEKHTSAVFIESNLEDSSREVHPPATGALKKNAKLPVPTTPVQEQGSVQVSSSPVVPVKESLITNTAQLSSASGPVQATSQFEFHHLDMKEKLSPGPTSLPGSSPCPTPSTSSSHVSPSRKLSSPEKILNLHEQLQKTLMSSYQASESRGRELQPRRSQSLSSPADLNPASQTKKQNFTFNTPHTNSLSQLSLTIASSQAKHTPVLTTKSAATNKSATLFNAVASRSANATFSPSMLTNRRLKADLSTTTTSAPSSCSNFPFATMTPYKAESISSCETNITISPILTKKSTAIPDTSGATYAALTTFDSDITNPKTTAADVTAPSISPAPMVGIFNMTSKTNGASYDGFAFATTLTQSAHCSPARSNKPARKSAAALRETKTARPKPEAPAEVRSVEVIKTVGQSSLMIGWERPPLDELGCSNGTFVYGYRVFVDGDFHKSVMSSACTKCVLEHVDLSVPVHISVQTLGSNGLSSNSAHTMYRTSVRTDLH